MAHIQEKGWFSHSHKDGRNGKNGTWLPRNEFDLDDVIEAYQKTDK